MEHINDIREAVARALEQRGLSNTRLLGEIREGKRDDGPFMTGALARDQRLQHKGARHNDRCSNSARGCARDLRCRVSRRRMDADPVR